MEFTEDQPIQARTLKMATTMQVRLLVANWKLGRAYSILHRTIRTKTGKAPSDACCGRKSVTVTRSGELHTYKPNAGPKVEK